jgi:hypothetical protein
VAKIKHEEKIPFDDGDVYVLWYSSDEEGYGVEVLGENGKGGDLVGMNDWSFGFGTEPYVVSAEWLSYVVRHIEREAENSEWPIPKEIDAINCRYEPENPMFHLVDYKKVKEMINYDEI